MITSDSLTETRMPLTDAEELSVRERLLDELDHLIESVTEYDDGVSASCNERPLADFEDALLEARSVIAASVELWLDISECEEA